ncbi:hypothetical protein Hanom_Chr13g01190641 [Helianthus anomalus]
MNFGTEDNCEQLIKMRLLGFDFLIFIGFISSGLGPTPTSPISCFKWPTNSYEPVFKARTP